MKIELISEFESVEISSEKVVFLDVGNKSYVITPQGEIITEEDYINEWQRA